MTHYQLTFVTSNGSLRGFRVNNVDPAITQQDPQAAVDMLLDHDIMALERGSLNRWHSITANTNHINQPAGIGQYHIAPVNLCLRGCLHMRKG